MVVGIYIMTSEAARLLGKSEQTVRSYERIGKLPAIKTSLGKRLFLESDVKELAQKLNSHSQEKDS